MLTNVAKRLQESAKKVLWQQWQAVGAMVSSPRKAKAIVDPEALVLLSLALRDYERRLWDILAWWAAMGSTLVSVQRIRNLAQKFPEPVQDRLSEFARLAFETGGDFRWKSLAGSSLGPKVRAQKKRQTEPELIEPPALILRLRLGLGVGIKADILSYLLGIRGSWASVKDMAAATCYSNRAIRRAAEDMAAARLIKAKAETPAEYHVYSQHWAKILEVQEPLPLWRFWHPPFAFVAQCLQWLEGDASKETSYVTSSQARDLFEIHRSTFSWNQIAVPDPGDYRGAEYLDGFYETVSRLLDWLEESA
jgi:hypothetical protein